ncbi:flagellar assembly protein FliH, partial [Xanthomonas sp. Kuri4-2]
MSAVVRWLAPDLDTPPPPVLDEQPYDDEPEPILRPPTLEEIQSIQEAAQQEGFERGHAEGFAQGQAEVRRLTAQIEGILDNFTRPLARLENEVVGALGELAVRIAGQLVGRAY